VFVSYHSPLTTVGKWIKFLFIQRLDELSASLPANMYYKTIFQILEAHLVIRRVTHCSDTGVGLPKLSHPKMRLSNGQFVPLGGGLVFR
jgi:hypothetical protein